MKKNLLLFAALLSLSLSAGCNLKVYQLEKRIERWNSMQRKDTDPEKMAAFATESILFFLRSPQLQRTREITISEQERLNYHRQMTPMQFYLVSLHATKAVAATDRPDPDWELGRAEWILADSLMLGRIPGHPTQFPLVFVQNGYKKLVHDLILHPEKYEQYTRDFPGLIKVLRTMSRYMLLDARKELSNGQRDIALEKFEQVFTHDFDNFAIADSTVRAFTGLGIRAQVVRRFWTKRYQETFDNNRMEVFSMVSQGLQQANEETDEAKADSLLDEVISSVADNFNLTKEHTADFYFYIRSLQQGNLPEYLRLWRHHVLEGRKPLRPPYSE